MSELGSWLEVSRSTVSTWARYPGGENSRPPSSETVAYIAEYFNVPLTALSSVRAAREHS